MPFCMASRISGFGYGHVGKLPSGCSCSGTTVTSDTPARASTVVTGTRPVPFSGVYTSFSGAEAICSGVRLFTDCASTAS